ncbi:MAG: PKD domain-containing protein [Flavobacteriia bacterium]|nr:PKD domain-containing protein [Flavobacteriia bacterium]
MLKFIPLLILCLTVQSVQAQITLCLGQDTTVCPGNSVTINNCNIGNINNVTGIYLNQPNQVNLSDDQWSGVVNVGFPFNFYGQNYNQCVIGSNGLISFNLANANGYCPWSLSGIPPLPNATLTSARNSIMLTYQDINPSLGGQIQYQTVGSAPNRRFVVLYKNIMMFSCTQQCNYMAIILYETTNIFELHIGNKPICAGWNSGLAIQGSENNPMTVAHITPGRNNTVWGANQDARRFTPTAPNNTNNYTMAQIPYILVSSPGTNFIWANTLGQTFPYNNGVLVVNPVPTPGPTGYFLSGSACNASIGSITNDTTWLSIGGAAVNVTAVNDICSQSIGSVTANPTAGTPPFTYTWNPNVGNTQTVNNLPAGTYTVTVQDAGGCPGTGTGVVGNNPATYSGTMTQVSCPGGSNGTATAQITPPAAGTTYTWSNGQTTQTATGLSAGTYTCVVATPTGCTGTVTVTVTEIPGMQLTLSNVANANCNSASNGTATVNVVLGTPSYSYQWIGGSASTSNTAIDLGAGSHTIIVTDANGCTIDTTIVIGEPPSLQLIFLTQDTMICPEASIQLTAIGSGGSTPYTYSWVDDAGNVFGPGSTVTVDPSSTPTQYCVTLSEQCGSPHDQQCMTITFPTPIVPSISPNYPILCMPGNFTFSNTSSNSAEIASSHYVFSNGDQMNVPGVQGFSNSFPNPGLYSVNITATSIYGCVYSNSMQDIVEVTPLPVADFVLSRNPVTWFETTVQANDNSQGNIVDWQWSCLDAEHITSNGMNAMFTFPQGQVGTYYINLTVTTAQGCSDSISLPLQIIPDVVFYVPNTFTPDNDEHNQTWKFYIDGIDQSGFHLTVYNRWGEMVWETYDPNGEWDGQYGGNKVTPGIYTWTAWYKERDTDGKKIKQGFVNILR